MARVISARRVTARKDHHCGYCDAVAIKRGEDYLRETLVADGRICTWVSCLACQELFGQVWQWAGEPYDEGIGRDTFTEWAHEMLADRDPVWSDRAMAYLARSLKVTE